MIIIREIKALTHTRNISVVVVTRCEILYSFAAKSSAFSEALQLRRYIGNVGQNHFAETNKQSLCNYLSFSRFVTRMAPGLPLQCFFVQYSVKSGEDDHPSCAC